MGDTVAAAAGPPEDDVRARGAFTGETGVAFTGCKEQVSKWGSTHLLYLMLVCVRVSVRV